MKSTLSGIIMPSSPSVTITEAEVTINLVPAFFFEQGSKLHPEIGYMAIFLSSLNTEKLVATSKVTNDTVISVRFSFFLSSYSLSQSCNVNIRVQWGSYIIGLMGSLVGLLALWKVGLKFVEFSYQWAQDLAITKGNPQSRLSCNSGEVQLSSLSL
jgi:hypothetical protein